MKALSTTCMFIIFIIVICHTWPAFAQKPKKETPWTGTLEDGTMISEAELVRILKLHIKWLRSEEREGKKANLKRICLTIMSQNFMIK